MKKLLGRLGCQPFQHPVRHVDTCYQKRPNTPIARNRLLYVPTITRTGTTAIDEADYTKFKAIENIPVAFPIA